MPGSGTNDTAVALLRKGKPYKEVAAVCGVSVSRVAFIAKRAGLQRYARARARRGSDPSEKRHFRLVLAFEPASRSVAVERALVAKVLRAARRERRAIERLGLTYRVGSIVLFPA